MTKRGLTIRLALVLGGLVAVAGVLIGWRRAPAATRPAAPPDLRVGQEWRFQGRPIDPDPHLVIVKVQTHPKMPAITHISVLGVRVRNRHIPGGVSTEVAHMPFARTAIERSVLTLVHDSAALPSYRAGYEEWRRAAGGVFTVSVSEGLDFIERTLQ